MRRASLERPRTLRVWRAHIRLIHPDGIPNCTCEFQPGRFRKGQRVGGCGRPRCHTCHFNKLLGLPTAQQHRAGLSLHEWLSELGLSSQRPRFPG
jgi:transposase-like protein